MPIINSVIAGGGSPAPSGKYQLLQRVTDDSNNEIGTVGSFFTDGNNIEYAVVVLDAQYRMENGQYLDNYAEVVAMPQYVDASVWEDRNRATDWCNAIPSYGTSSAVSHCRSKSFIIEGTTYYGQLPTIVELVDLLKNRTSINTLDASASQYASFLLTTDKGYWSSTQNNQTMGWTVTNLGVSNRQLKNKTSFVIPILELPNA